MKKLFTALVIMVCIVLIPADARAFVGQARYEQFHAIEDYENDEGSYNVFMYHHLLTEIPAPFFDGRKDNPEQLWIPFRATAEIAGMEVNWDNATRTVAASYNGHSKEFGIDGKNSKISDNMTYVSFSFMADLLRDFHGGIRLYFPLNFDDYTTVDFDAYNIRFDFPVSWDGKYSVTENDPTDGGLVICHTATEDLLGAGEGELFKLNRIPGEFTNPNTISADGNVLIITNDDGYCYYYEERTSAPVYPIPGTETEAEYYEMKEQVKEFLGSLSLIEEDKW